MQPFAGNGEIRWLDGNAMQPSGLVNCDLFHRICEIVPFRLAIPKLTFGT